jgi:hypothetical protein
MAPIDDAIADLESQEPGEKLVLTEFAKKWGVHRSTLSRRWRRVTVCREAGYAHQQALSPQQELELIQYIKDLTKKGLPPTREMIRNFSSEVAHQQLTLWYQRGVKNTAWLQVKKHRKKTHENTAESGKYTPQNQVNIHRRIR